MNNDYLKWKRIACIFKYPYPQSMGNFKRLKKKENKKNPFWQKSDVPYKSLLDTISWWMMIVCPSLLWRDIFPGERWITRQSWCFGMLTRCAQSTFRWLCDQNEVQSKQLQNFYFVTLSYILKDWFKQIRRRSQKFSLLFYETGRKLICWNRLEYHVSVFNIMANSANG